MNYEHECSCGHLFTVIKKMEARDNPEYCLVCGNAEVPRRKVPTTIHINKTAAADWNSHAYNPSLGKVVTTQEGRKEAKRRGMTEIGDEPVEKIHKKFDTERKKRAEYNLSDITNLGSITTK